MPILKVTYEKDSSTAGFATAGQEITARLPQDANTIRKDADMGNVELTSAEQKLVDRFVDQDTLDYSNEEMEKVGENQINTKGEGGEDLSEKDQKAGSNAAVAVAATSATAGATAVIALAAGAKLSDGFSGTIMGIAAVALGATNLALSISNVFDPNLDERESQTNNAAGNNSLLQQYTDKMNADMEAMVEESGTYIELSDMTTQMTMDSITNIGALQAEMQVYQAQGNTEKVAELKGQIEKLQGSSEKELEGPQKDMETIKGNVEQYTGSNAEAQGVASSGSTVSTFLQAGEPMNRKAQACMYMQMAAALACASTIIFPKFWTPFGFPLDGANAAIGTILFAGSASLLFGSAAVMMNKNAKSEGNAADAGDEMSDYVASLNENIEGQAGFTEAAAAGYTETDEASTEMTEQTQKETDKANQKQAQTLGGQQKPEEKKKEEKPDVTANAGAGAGTGAGGAAA